MNSSPTWRPIWQATLMIVVALIGLAWPGWTAPPGFQPGLYGDTTAPGATAPDSTRLQGPPPPQAGSLDSAPARDAVGEDSEDARPARPTNGLKQEARAIWVVRYSLVSPARVHAIVERAYRYHFNALMVQVRGRGDAFYQSDIEPRADDLDSQPESFDPLAQIIREAHRRGIQVYAWVNTMLVWSGKRPPTSPMHVVNEHPDWIDAHADGAPMRATEFEGQFLNPGIPAVRDYIVGLCRDIVRRYDVDGIHLDYIRYPDPSVGYNHAALICFHNWLHPDEPCPDAAGLREEARAAAPQFAAWREAQVTELVREIRQAIQAEKPWVSLSAAVWANLDDAHGSVLQDWPTWLKDGLVDFVCPMAYSTSTARVANQIRQAVELSHGRQIWAGLGAWQIKPASTIAKIDAARKLGAAGVCLFSYDGLTHDDGSETYMAALRHGPFEKPACVPPMPWLPQPGTFQASRPTHNGQKG